MFTPNEKDEVEDNHIKNFAIEIGLKVYVYVGEEVFSFETTDKTFEISSEQKNFDIEFTFA